MLINMLEILFHCRKDWYLICIYMYGMPERLYWPNGPHRSKGALLGLFSKRFIPQGFTLMT